MKKPRRRGGGYGMLVLMSLLWVGEFVLIAILALKVVVVSLIGMGWSLVSGNTEGTDDENS